MRFIFIPFSILHRYLRILYKQLKDDVDSFKRKKHSEKKVGIHAGCEDRARAAPAGRR